jgi:DNA polymerase-3 subunit epsilon
MARLVMLDTETTGLNARLGDRIVELGCIEMLGRRIGERQFHAYVNPEREVDEGASRVHGLTLDDLKDKPRFAEVAAEFLDFIRGAQLVIHNASFDVEFLDQELSRAKLGKLAEHVAGVTDSLAMARELHPGKKNSLDALCERYGVDNANRTLHGALLDARLLAECYLAMTRGQEGLSLDLEAAPAAGAVAALKVDASNLAVLRATPEEAAAHDKYLDGMEKGAKAPIVWRRSG